MDGGGAGEGGPEGVNILSFTGFVFSILETQMRVLEKKTTSKQLFQDGNL